MSEITEDDLGNKTCFLPGYPIITVLNEGNIKLFMRNGIKVALDNNEEMSRSRWVVGELDGVRVYIQDDHIVMTKQDLYP